MTDDAPTSPAQLRRTVHFSGRVQGVGFRFTAEAIASRFAVAGYVKNLRDGRVELVAEGSLDELDRFQGALERAMERNIRDVCASDTPATGQFSSFDIAF